MSVSLNFLTSCLWPSGPSSLVTTEDAKLHFKSILQFIKKTKKALLLTVVCMKQTGNRVFVEDYFNPHLVL